MVNTPTLGAGHGGLDDRLDQGDNVQALDIDLNVDIEPIHFIINVNVKCKMYFL